MIIAISVLTYYALGCMFIIKIAPPLLANNVEDEPDYKAIVKLVLFAQLLWPIWGFLFLCDWMRGLDVGEH